MTNEEVTPQQHGNISEKKAACHPPQGAVTGDSGRGRSGAWGRLTKPAEATGDALSIFLSNCICNICSQQKQTKIPNHGTQSEHLGIKERPGTSLSSPCPGDLVSHPLGPPRHVLCACKEKDPVITFCMLVVCRHSGTSPSRNCGVSASVSPWELEGGGANSVKTPGWGPATLPTPTAQGDSRRWSFLLVIVAGTGRPTSDLTSKLLNQLWVLLLHLLGKLLAPGREVPGSAGLAHTQLLPR